MSRSLLPANNVERQKRVGCPCVTSVSTDLRCEADRDRSRTRRRSSPSSFIHHFRSFHFQQLQSIPSSKSFNPRSLIGHHRHYPGRIRMKIEIPVRILPRSRSLDRREVEKSICDSASTFSFDSSSALHPPCGDSYCYIILNQSPPPFNG